MFEAWFLLETVDIAGTYWLDHLTGCHAISSSLSEFGKQQPWKGSGRLIRIGNACGKYPA
ncbi:MAG: hypothetical protein OXF95_07030 [Rhodobacteraceae bacterium]|nr:hypothetical protein [Paracoccaceae bacterium]